MSDQEFVIKLWEVTVSGLAWPTTVVIVAYLLKLALSSQITDTPAERTDASPTAPKAQASLSSLQVRPASPPRSNVPPVNR